MVKKQIPCILTSHDRSFDLWGVFSAKSKRSSIGIMVTEKALRI